MGRASRILLLLFVAGVGTAGARTAQAQAPRDYTATQLTHETTSLRGFHGRPVPITRSFRSDAEATTVLRKVLAAAGLGGMEDRIFLRASAQAQDAEASMEGGNRVVFYNVAFMQRLKEQTGDYWSLVAVLAHEVGHHIRLHTVIPGRDHEFELEADYQAGYIMRRMGATREQVEVSFSTMPAAATPSHPGRADRQQSALLGWVDGGAVHSLGLVGSDAGGRSAPPAAVPTAPPARPAESQAVAAATTAQSSGGAAAPVHECDRLAAAPGDKDARAAAVPLALITPAAVTACEAAIRAFPGERRFLTQLARTLSGVKRHAEARELYEKAAEAGHARAMNNLGVLYQHGRGVTQDYGQARAWYEKAVAAGDTSALVALGGMYSEGHGVAQDYAKAREWYEKAAAVGYPAGMSNLGFLYAKGYGVAQDYAKARHWYEKAAAAGDTWALLSLGGMYSEGQGVARDYVKAREWYEKAAAAGVSGGLSNLGFLYAKGYGVAQDYAKARDWYEKAAAAGEGTGTGNLASLLDRGQGGPVDHPRAAKLLLQVARLGDEHFLQQLRGDMSSWSALTRTELQRELTRLGHYSGKLEGTWGDTSHAALERYLAAK